MTCIPIWQSLERQVPDWYSKPWGVAVDAALRGSDDDVIFQVWKEFASSREDMAHLICFVLETLDSTGLNEKNEFHAVYLFGNKEIAVPIPRKLNDWALALRDTGMNSAYVVLNDICLDSDLANDGSSSCKGQPTFTVLHSQLATTRNLRIRSPKKDKVVCFNLKLANELFFEGVSSGSIGILLLEPLSTFHRLFQRWRPGSTFNCYELTDQSRFLGTNEAYFQASRHSYRGRCEAEREPLFPPQLLTKSINWSRRHRSTADTL